MGVPRIILAALPGLARWRIPGNFEDLSQTVSIPDCLPGGYLFVREGTHPLQDLAIYPPAKAGSARVGLTRSWPIP